MELFSSFIFQIFSFKIFPLQQLLDSTFLQQILIVLSLKYSLCSIFTDSRMSVFFHRPQLTCSWQMWMVLGLGTIIRERRRNYFWESTLLYSYSTRMLQGSKQEQDENIQFGWCAPSPLGYLLKKCQNQPNQPLLFGQCPKQRVFFWDFFPKLSNQAGYERMRIRLWGGEDVED